MGVAGPDGAAVGATTSTGEEIGRVTAGDDFPQGDCSGVIPRDGVTERRGRNDVTPDALPAVVTPPSYSDFILVSAARSVVGRGCSSSVTGGTGPLRVAGSSTGYLPGSWNVDPGGAFGYTMPLDVPAGRAGVAPSLALRYSSDS